MTASDEDTGGTEAAGEVRRTKVEAYAVVAHPPRPDLQALVGLAAQICDVEGAEISLVAGSVRQVAGIGPSAGSGEVAFRDARDLVAPDGVVIGTLCVWDTSPHVLTADQRGALGVLVDIVVDALELGLRSRLLEETVAQLTAAREELRQLQVETRAFAEQVSHDLRNPLTSVSMSLQMLEDQPSLAADKDAAWMVARALSGARQLESLIERLLSSATESSGHSRS